MRPQRFYIINSIASIERRGYGLGHDRQEQHTVCVCLDPIEADRVYRALMKQLSKVTEVKDKNAYYPMANEILNGVRTEIDGEPILDPDMAIWLREYRSITYAVDIALDDPTARCLCKDYKGPIHSNCPFHADDPIELAKRQREYGGSRDGGTFVDRLLEPGDYIKVTPETLEMYGRAFRSESKGSDGVVTSKDSLM